MLASPAVVSGRAYVVDQMGTAYCVDPDSAAIVWKSAPDGQETPRVARLSVHEHRGQVQPATGKRCDWPSPFGGSHDNSFIDDEALKPPFRMRWAVRASASFKQSPSAVGNDPLFHSEEGTVACLEQGTGRLHWRTRLSDAIAGARLYDSLLCAEGKVFAHGSQPRDSRFFCFEPDGK